MRPAPHMCRCALRSLLCLSVAASERIIRNTEGRRPLRSAPNLWRCALRTSLSLCVAASEHKHIIRNAPGRRPLRSAPNTPVALRPKKCLSLCVAASEHIIRNGQGRRPLRSAPNLWHCALRTFLFCASRALSNCFPIQESPEHLVWCPQNTALHSWSPVAAHLTHMSKARRHLARAAEWPLGRM